MSFFQFARMIVVVVIIITCAYMEVEYQYNN